MPNLTRLERLVETAISLWSQEEIRPSQSSDLLTDLDERTQENPSGRQNLSFGNPPLTLLSLEGSDRTWFKLGDMSLNLWLGKQSSPVEPKYLKRRRLHYELGGTQTSAMYYELGQHTVRIESSSLTRGSGTVRFASMSEVFVDGVLAGTAFGSAIKSGAPAPFGYRHRYVHNIPPAYVRVEGVLLAVYGPRPGWSLFSSEDPWNLIPPRVEVWLEITKNELDTIVGLRQTQHGVEDDVPPDRVGLLQQLLRTKGALPSSPRPPGKRPLKSPRKAKRQDEGSTPDE